MGSNWSIRLIREGSKALGIKTNKVRNLATRFNFK